MPRREFTPVLGEPTLRNKVVCKLLGHLPPPQPWWPKGLQQPCARCGRTVQFTAAQARSA